MPLQTLYRIRHLLTAALLTGSFAMLAAPAFAAAQKLGDVTNSIYTSLLPVQVFIGTIVFILGTWYVYKGVMSLRASAEGGQGAPPVPASLFKLGGGGALISLPFIANAVISSVTNDSTTVTNLVSSQHSFSEAGLDHALGRFVNDFFQPFMDEALPFFCYIAGLIMIIRGIQRLANGDGKGPQAPGGLGTFTIFIVASLLMSLGYFMGILQGSIFGVTDLYADALLADKSPLSERAQNVLWAVFQFLRIVGYISVIRGLFIFKAANDGGNVSLLGGITHIIAGAMLANVWHFIWVVQNTFVVDPSYFVFLQPPG